MAVLAHSTIVSGAKSVVRTKGTRNTTIGDIADQCNCARQTIYYHFRGMDDLLREMLFSDCEGVAYYGIDELGWKNEMYRMLCSLKKNAWLPADLYTTRRDFLYNTLLEFISKNISPRFLTAHRHTGTEQALEMLSGTISFFLTGSIMHWASEGLREEPEDILRRIDIFCGNPMHRAMDRYLTDLRTGNEPEKYF